MTLDLGDIAVLIKVGAAIIGCVTAIVGMSLKVWSMLEKKKAKMSEMQDERRYDRELQLERDKIALQKELEAQKQQHTQKLIEAIRLEMGKLEGEVKQLAVEFARTDEKLKNNAELVRDFVESTTSRFSIVETELGSVRTGLEKFKTEVLKIRDDLKAIREIARHSNHNLKGG